MGRRSFSRSVVVTLSLAELACGGGEAKPEPQPRGNPPPLEKSAETRADAPKKEAPEIPRKTPGTDLPPEEPSGYVEVDPYAPPKHKVDGDMLTVMLQPEGKCREIKRIDCPPGKHCNPPPPRTIDCPQELALPAAKTPDALWQKRDRTCWEPEDGACKPGTEGCVEPKARRVVCPDSMQPPDPPPKDDDDDHSDDDE